MLPRNHFSRKLSFYIWSQPFNNILKVILELTISIMKIELALQLFLNYIFHLEKFTQVSWSIISSKKTSKILVVTEKKKTPHKKPYNPRSPMKREDNLVLIWKQETWYQKLSLYKGQRAGMHRYGLRRYCVVRALLHKASHFYRHHNYKGEKNPGPNQ